MHFNFRRILHPRCAGVANALITHTRLVFSKVYCELNLCMQMCRDGVQEYSMQCNWHRGTAVGELWGDKHCHQAAPA